MRLQQEVLLNSIKEKCEGLDSRGLSSNFRIKDKLRTPVLTIVEKLFLLGNHHFLTVYLIFDCSYKVY